MHLRLTVPTTCPLPGQIEGFDQVMTAANSYKIKDWKLFWRGSERTCFKTLDGCSCLAAYNTGWLLMPECP